MPNRMTLLAACALLCGSAYADEHALFPSNLNQNGADETVKQKLGGTAVNRGHVPIHGESKDNMRSPDFSSYGTSILDVGATEWRAIPEPSGSPASNATVGTGPVPGKTAFLLQREHDTAVRLLTTNVALRFKLSADGVYLNLAF